MGVTGITEANCFQPEHPLASVIEGTGVLVLGGEVKNRYVYGVAQTPTQLLGRQRSDPSLLDERATSTSRQNLLQIQYLNRFPVARAPSGSKVM